MPRILRWPLAGADTAEILDASPRTASSRRTHGSIAWTPSCNCWATQPLMGRARDELLPGLRSMPFGRYVIFYEPLSDGIDVVRVLHSARDIDAVFADDAPGP